MEISKNPAVYGDTDDVEQFFKTLIAAPEWRHLAGLEYDAEKVKKIFDMFRGYSNEAVLWMRNSSDEGAVINFYIECFMELALIPDARLIMANPIPDGANPWPGVQDYDLRDMFDFCDLHYGDIHEFIRIKKQEAIDRGEDKKWGQPVEANFIKYDPADNKIDDDKIAELEKHRKKYTPMKLPEVSTAPPPRMSSYPTYDALLAAEYAIDEAEHVHHELCMAELLDHGNWPATLINAPPIGFVNLYEDLGDNLN